MYCSHLISVPLEGSRENALKGQVGGAAFSTLTPRTQVAAPCAFVFLCFINYFIWKKKKKSSLVDKTNILAVLHWILESDSCQNCLYNVFIFPGESWNHNTILLECKVGHSISLWGIEENCCLSPLFYKLDLYIVWGKL